jgi:hypothetical protein
MLARPKAFLRWYYHKPALVSGNLTLRPDRSFCFAVAASGELDPVNIMLIVFLSSRIVLTGSEIRISELPRIRDRTAWLLW